MKKIILFIVLMLVLVSSVSALENSMKLLAVKETSDGFEGSLAELNLEIRSGKGRVLLETSPLTKIDTQVSTRIAQEISCNYLDLDCSNLDFIYTIKSDSSIVGGPSAGSAMAVMTILTLSNLKISEDTVITGTINSGNLIGPVGGIKEKIEIAQKSGFNKILIPLGEFIDLGDNKTINLSEFKKNQSIEIIEVSTLDSALFEFTGTNFRNVSTKELVVDEEYIGIMKKVSDKLCQRTYDMIGSVYDENYSKQYENFSLEVNKLFDKKDYYSGASKCFSANIGLRTYLSNENNISISYSINQLIKDINNFETDLNNKKINNVPNLQTFIIVKERLNDAKHNNNEALSQLMKNNTKSAISLYSYALERFDAASSWSTFFEKEGKKLNINENILAKTCFNKIQEANSRIQYLNSIIDNGLTELNEDLNQAKKESENGEYALCLNYASLAKANADTIIGGSSFRNESEIKDLIELKLDIAKQIISEQQDKGLFPILGYSYYEYSKNLINTSTYSSLLFAQYSLELSDFSLYLENGDKKQIVLEGDKIVDHKTNYEMFIIYAFGFITGAIVAFMLYHSLRN